MKRDINLIVKRQTDTKAAKGILFALIFLMILGAMYFAATSIPQMIKSAELIKKADLERKIAELSHTREKFEAGTEAKKKLLESISLVEELDANKKDNHEILSFIERVCPYGVSIMAIKFTAENLDLIGYADTDLLLSQFVLGLRENTAFKSVVGMQTAIVEKSTKQGFTVSITFTEPMKAEPIVVAKPDATQTPAPAATPTAE